MSFMNPSYLWALIGLLVPIAIHLWSKKEGKTIKVGSIEHFSEEDSRQSRSIGLSEILLLMLRMAIITLVAFIMAGPQLNVERSNTPVTYFFEPSLLQDGIIDQAMIDSLQVRGSVKLLQEGFPDYEEDIHDGELEKAPKYWQLAQAMETIQTDSIVVFANALSRGLIGKRPSIRTNINWIVLDNGKTSSSIIEARRTGDSIQFLTAVSNGRMLRFLKDKVSVNNPDIAINATQDSVTVSRNGLESRIEISSEIPTKVLLHYTDSYIKEATYLEAGLNAVSSYLSRNLDVIKATDVSDIDLNEFQNIIWLNDANMPINNGVTLAFEPDELAGNLIEPGLTSREYLLTSRLNAQNIIDRNLTEDLLNWLQFRTGIDELVKPHDLRVADKDEIQTQFKANIETISKVKAMSISKWLWILMALLLLGERIVAKLRRQ